MHASFDLAVAADEAFAFVDDYRNGPKWMYGLRSSTPVPGMADTGLGAMHDGALNLGPMTLTIRSEITAYETGRLIGFTATKGIEGTMTIAFSPTGDATCRIDFDVSYRLPGGLRGRLLTGALDVFTGPAVTRTEGNLRRELERG